MAEAGTGSSDFRRAALLVALSQQVTRHPNPNGAVCPRFLHSPSSRPDLLVPAPEGDSIDTTWGGAQ